MNTARQPKGERSRRRARLTMDYRSLRTFAAVARAVWRRVSVATNWGLARTWTTQRISILRSGHFWLILALIMFCTIFHYGEQIGFFGTTPSLHFGLTRHAADRILFLLPIIYCGFVFGFKASLVTSSVALLAMLPMAIFISPVPADALFEVAAILLVGLSASVVVWATRARARELEASEDKYRHLVEDIDEGYLVLRGRRVVFANKRCSETLGIPHEKLVGGSFAEFVAPEALERVMELYRTSISGGELPELVEFVLIRADGARLLAEISFNDITFEGKPSVALLIRDITERKKAEEELLRHAERLAVTAELTHIITSSLNIEDVYDAFAAGVRRLVDADRISVALVEEDEVRLLAVYSEVETGRKAGTTFPLKRTGTAWVVQNRKTSIETDLAQERQFPIDEVSLREGLRSAIRLPLISRGDVIGSFNLFSRRPYAYADREQEILEELAGQIAVAIENHRLFEELSQRKEELESAYRLALSHSQALERSKQELENAYIKMARTLALTLEARDPYSRGHSERVAQIARQLAFEMGLPQDEIQKLETAARLHDLGKIGIPDGILLKPGGITPSERAEIQLHPTKAVELLRFLGFLNGVLPMVEHHHERYDGGGYPSSLKGEDIPLGARILAVADAYDAMTSARPYREAMTSEKAMQILKDGAGTQWDARVVDAFFRAFGNKDEAKNAR